MGFTTSNVFHHPYAAGQFHIALQDLQTHESLIPTHNPAALHNNCITIPTLESLFRWPGEILPTHVQHTRHLNRETEISLRQTLPDQEKDRLVPYYVDYCGLLLF